MKLTQSRKGGPEDLLDQNLQPSYEARQPVYRPPGSQSETWAALASKQSEPDLDPSRADSLVSYPYEGAGGTGTRTGRDGSIELAPLQEPRRTGEINTGVDSTNRLYYR